MDWAFFRVEVSAPHAKSPTGDKHHSLHRRFHDVRPPSDDISQGDLLPHLLHSAGHGTQRRRDGSSADETLSTRSDRHSRVSPPKRDSSSDSNAVTSAAVHRAPFTPPQAHGRPLRRPRWLLLITGGCGGSGSGAAPG